MQSLKQYQIRWTTGRKVECDCLRAASAAEARQAFQEVRGVRVLSVELVTGAEGGVVAQPRLLAPDRSLAA